MIPQDVVDNIHDDIDNSIENMSKEVSHFVNEHVKSRLDYEHDVDFLYGKMKDNNHRISRATVYNTLDLLVECDLVSKHQFGKNLAQFEKAYGYKQHDHLICTDCHKVVEFCDPRIQNIQNTVGDLLEFKIMHHSLILYASCNKHKCENKLVNELSA